MSRLWPDLRFMLGFKPFTELPESVTLRVKIINERVKFTFLEASMDDMHRHASASDPRPRCLQIKFLRKGDKAKLI